MGLVLVVVLPGCSSPRTESTGSVGSSGTAGSDGSAGAASGGTSGAGGGTPNCNAPLEAGACLGIQQRWGYDVAAQRCVSFAYGGCAGNDNNFKTQAECVAACDAKCAPDQAQAEGLCPNQLGYKWNGRYCVEVAGCSCAGADCGGLESLAACESSHSTCNLGCAPREARGQGDCETFFGYGWNGLGCAAVVGCECVGAGCANVESLNACLSRYSSCFGRADCPAERGALIDFINANKSCTVSSDCQLAHAGCGVSEDDCTNAVYVNQATDLLQLENLQMSLGLCAGEECRGGCLRGSRAPACIEGQCRPSKALF